MKRPGSVERACFVVASGVLAVSALIGFDEPYGSLVAVLVILYGGWGVVFFVRQWLAGKRQRKMQTAS